METLEAKAALINAIIRAAKVATEAGLSEESIASVMEMIKETIENGE